LFSFLNLSLTDVFEENVKTLKQLLLAHKLISRHTHHDAMETDDHVTDASQSEDRQPSDDLPVTFVQLWPVFELQAVLEGSRKLARLLLSDDNGCYDNCYHSYLVYFTPESPESLAVLKQTNDENKMVGNSCLFKLRTCVQVLQLTT